MLCTITSSLCPLGLKRFGQLVDFRLLLHLAWEIAGGAEIAAEFFDRAVSRAHFDM